MHTDSADVVIVASLRVAQGEHVKVYARGKLAREVGERRNTPVVLVRLETGYD
jgi:hypothetical protein